MSNANYRLMTETTGQRIAEALEDISAMQGPKGDKGDTGDTGPTGPKGDPGDDYTLTSADKTEIAGIIENDIGNNYVKTNAAQTLTEAQMQQARQNIGVDSAVIVESVTTPAPIMTIDDGAAANARDLVIGIEPVQAGSGDPSPTNVRPISGWTGANVSRTGYYHRLIPVTNYSTGDTILSSNGVTIQYLGTGKYRIYSTGTSSHVETTKVPIKEFLTLNTSNPGRTVRWNNPQYDSNVQIGLYNGSTYVDSWTLEKANKSYTGYNAMAGKMINRINVIVTNAAGPFDIVFMAEFLDQNEEVVVPISWQSSAGTVYGGTLDVTTGVLTVDRASKTVNGSESNWTFVNASGGYFYYASTENLFIGFKRNTPVICDKLGQSISGSDFASNEFVTFSASQLNFKVGADVKTVDAFKAWLSSNNLQVVYELAAPTEIPLTPTEVTTLLGTNNIWADCGDVQSLEYVADTKLYIQKINTPTDDDMTADAQIASGKYFIIGNNLYLSTTTIPAGDTINPGTNCTLTNLADALNALNS